VVHATFRVQSRALDNKKYLKYHLVGQDGQGIRQVNDKTFENGFTFNVESVSANDYKLVKNNFEPINIPPGEQKIPDLENQDETPLGRVYEGVATFKPQVSPNDDYSAYMDKLASDTSARDEFNMSQIERERIRAFTDARRNPLLTRLMKKCPYDVELHAIQQGIVNSNQPNMLPNECYRVAQYHPDEFAAIQRDSFVFFPTLLSASRIITNWAGNTLMVIKLTSGRRTMCCDVRPVSVYPNEFEILFGLNSPFQILAKSSYEQTGNASNHRFRYVIEMELMA